MATAQVQEPTGVPSHMRCAPGSVNIVPATFPAVTPTPASQNPAVVAKEFVDSFNGALERKDYDALSSSFLDCGYWRDHLALTWEFRTVRSPAKISDYLRSCADSRDGFRLKRIALDDGTETRSPKTWTVDGEGKVAGIQLFITGETVLGSLVGLVRLAEHNGAWKVFTMYTRLDELTGYEERIYSRRGRGVKHGEVAQKNWAEQRVSEMDFEGGDEPVVMIVGAGQAGLTVAARLKMLGVKALIIDQNDRVGDNWRKRYHQLVLHDPVWYDHLPYMHFPPQWPIYTPKDKLGDWFEAYATLLELNVWTRTDLVDTQWNADTSSWTVTVERKNADGVSEKRTFHPRHLIQATGHSGKRNLPSFEGMDKFKGDRICHSSEFSGAREDGRGKKAVVVGACNSSMDISHAFLEKGYDVTVVQRSSTHVLTSKANVEICMTAYAEDGPHVDEADLLTHGTPLPVLKAQQVAIAGRAADADKATLDGLAKAGFMVDAGPDDAGLIIKYFQRGGGYYIDVGASQLIIDGKIKVKQGQEIKEILPHGLRFADGTELEADEIVFATGYQNMRTQTRTMFGDAVADKVADVWGLNEEGEMRTIWQRSGHPGFWFHGGNLALCRYYSKLLALQIKGIEEGLFQDNEM